jgi:FkbM family methyltransferase
MVDVGAYNPVFMSNSWVLEQMGWDVLCIEPNPKCLPGLMEQRNLVLPVACGSENAEGILDVYTLNAPFNLPADHPETVHEGAITGVRSSNKDVIAARKNQEKIHAHLIARTKEVTVDVRTLDWCLEKVKWDPPVHIVSIDVEGTEEDVLNGFDIPKWQPHIFCIENWEQDNRFERLLGPFGFSFVMRTGSVNEIYMHKERLKALHALQS